MPARYPPIAPRAPPSPTRSETAPARIEDFNNLNAQPDTEDYAQQLDALARDKRRFLVAHHPIRDALHLALQQPAGVLIQRYARTVASYGVSSPMPSDEPGEREAGTAADLDARPAIVAYTETLVAKAILGDTAAIGLVSDRIEGKPGLRKADLDAQTEADRARVRAVVGVLVEAMTERHRGPSDIDGEATVVDDG